MKFTKMHGLGNDYLYVYDDKEPENPGELSIKLSDRHFGAGSDGMIWILPSEKADFKMRMFNADGSEGKMCGNGIRCVGKYVYDKGYTDKEEITVETLSGIKKLKLTVENGKVVLAAVDMGKADVSDKITVKTSYGDVTGYPVSVGNPHFVIFCQKSGIEEYTEKTGRLSAGADKECADNSERNNIEKIREDISANDLVIAQAGAKVSAESKEEFIDDITLKAIGSEIEHSPMFPEGVNVEFLYKTGANKFRMRVWERGSGITMACGTGTCASAAAAAGAGLADFDKDIAVELDGGILNINVANNFEILMTGPAATVYEAELV